MEIYNSPSYIGTYVDETIDTFGVITPDNMHQWESNMARILKTAVPRSRAQARELSEIPIIAKLILVDKNNPESIWLVDETFGSERKDKISIPGGHLDHIDYSDLDGVSISHTDFIGIMSHTLIREMCEEWASSMYDYLDWSLERMRIADGKYDITNALPWLLRQFNVSCEDEDLISPKETLYYHFIPNLSLAFYFIAYVTVDKHSQDIGKFIRFTRDDYIFSKDVLGQPMSKNRRSELAKARFEHVSKSDIRVFGNTPNIDKTVDMIFNTPGILKVN